MPTLSIVHPAARSAVRAAWQRTIRPRYDEAALEPAAQRIGRVLIIAIALALATVVVLTPATLIQALVFPTAPLQVLAHLALFPVFTAALMTAKAGRFRLTMLILNVAGTALVIARALTVPPSETPYLLNMLLAIVILNAFVLAPLSAVLIFAGQIALIIAFPFLFPRYDVLQTLVQTAFIHVLLGILALWLIPWYRREEAVQRRAMQAVQTALCQSDQRTRDLLAGLDAFVFSIDTAGRLVSFGGRQRFGAVEPHMVGLPIDRLAFAHPDLLGAIADAQIGRAAAISIDMDGRFCQFNIAPFYENDGPSAGSRIRGVSVIAFDATERIRAEADYVQLSLERERSALIDRLLSDFSHDVRTPLSVISTATYLIQKSVDESTHTRIEKHIVSIQKQVTHFIEQLQTVQNLVRANQESAEYEKVPVSAAVLVADVASEFTETAAGRGQHLRIHTPALDAMMICVDAHEMKRALRPILTNAINYTPHAGLITLTTTREADQVVITVHDTGEGIEAHALEHIFQPFYRGSRAREQGTGGMGLGLSLAKMIVEAHNGTIAVSSRVGEGSSFIVRLPALSESAVIPLSTSASAGA